MVTGSGERVVVVGDSWSAGLGLDEPVQSWPSRLPGRVHVAGFSGTGFSAHASPCGRVSFADRAPAALKGGADLVIVEGGLNDYDRSRAEIKAGFARVMRAAAPYRTVVVGPATAPARAAKVARVDRLLAHLSHKYAVAVRLGGGHGAALPRRPAAPHAEGSPDLRGRRRRADRAAPRRRR